jgi:hypothetical protein
MQKKHIIVAVVLVAIAAGAGFFGGMKYSQAKAAPAGNRQFTFNGAGGAGRRPGGAGSFVNGQVLSKDANTITVKNMAGGSQIVVLGSSTQYRKAVDGTADDVAIGSMVTITGSTNSDGSLTAQSVQIRTATGTPQGLPTK